MSAMRNCRIEGRRGNVLCAPKSSVLALLLLVVSPVASALVPPIATVATVAPTAIAIGLVDGFARGARIGIRRRRGAVGRGVRSFAGCHVARWQTDLIASGASCDLRLAAVRSKVFGCGNGQNELGVHAPIPAGRWGTEDPCNTGH